MNLFGKVYRGERCAIYEPAGKVTVDGEPLKHICRHSPDGFNWGYGGSGPADLALSILTDCIGEKEAKIYYQRYKNEVIAGLPMEGTWEITEAEIMKIITRWEEELCQA